jgi:hypothetical protein
MRNDSDALASLAALLTTHLWHPNIKLAQNVHVAMWWVRELRENRDTKKVEYLRRTISHQTHRVQQIAGEGKVTEDKLIVEIKALLSDLSRVWYPDPPKLQRINQLPLVDTFCCCSKLRTCRIVFILSEGESLWFGERQDAPMTNRSARCEGEVAYRSVDLKDGVGGVACIHDPVAVKIAIPAINSTNEQTLQWSQVCRDFALSLRRKWSDPDLFRSQVFLRHKGPNFPVHQGVQWMMSRRVKQEPVG